MSLDAFSVVVAFLAVIEAGLGVTVLAVALREARRPDGTGAGARRPLLALLAVTLLVVSVASIPLFQLLLASWVPRWPGIMCVEGVRRIGIGSIGAPAWLPSLVSSLDVTKPLAVFAAGVWLVLHRGGGVRPAALAAAALGLVACLDGASLAAYVVIPKEEIPAAAGCCTIAEHAAERESGLTAAGAAAGMTRSAAWAFALSAGMLGIGAALARGMRPVSAGRAALVAALAAASLPAAVSFLADVAAPAALGLPFHRCVWCAFAFAPETVAGASLHLGAVFCAGWAVAARLAAAGDDDAAARSLLRFASFGFLATAAMSAAVLWGA